MRHAQGIHNVAAEKNVDALLSDDLFDSGISSLGWQQVLTRSRHTNTRNRTCRNPVCNVMIITGCRASEAGSGEWDTE